jgi:hypothetical protein
MFSFNDKGKIALAIENAVRLGQFDYRGYITVFICSALICDSIINIDIHSVNVNIATLDVRVEKL